jgi:hypothetical protein
MMVMQILAAGPISADLHRYCGDSGLDAFVDSSTWADDERTIRPDTAAWHYLDIPRGTPKGDIAPFCPAPASCITSAINDQLAVLRDTTATAQSRADALRFIIHFFGDLHQPLHITTNDDRGGNCVPVRFFGLAPKETNAESESYSPNLHAVWDTNVVERLENGQTLQQLADALNIKYKDRIHKWQSTPIDIVAWAWDSHQLAERTSYGDLPAKIAIEMPVNVHTCADDDHISTRMLNLHEDLSAKYQKAAEKVAAEQLAKAGIRLAAELNALWPPEPSASGN